MTMRSAAGVGTATGKAIVLGEHLVVYGSAALAVPVPTLVETVTARRILPADDVPAPSKCLPGTGIATLISDFAQLLDVPEAVATEVALEASHALPYGRGLGASAAMARAAVLALADLFERTPSQAQIYELVQSVERTAHGSPSGVDAVATGAEGPIRFRRGTFQSINPAPGGVFVIADSGAASATKESVARVAAKLVGDGKTVDLRHRLVEQVDALVARAVVDLERGNLVALGSAMRQNHEVLRGLELSTPGLERLVAAANAGGALGAKLTGGGRGGCVLALAADCTDAEVIAEEMVKAGAVRTWSVRLDSFSQQLPVNSSRHECAR